MFRCDRKCDGKFKKFVGTKHTHGGKQKGTVSSCPGSHPINGKREHSRSAVGRSSELQDAPARPRHGAKPQQLLYSRPVQKSARLVFFCTVVFSHNTSRNIFLLITFVFLLVTETTHLEMPFFFHAKQTADTKATISIFLLHPQTIVEI